jgi:hypothetical protein
VEPSEQDGRARRMTSTAPGRDQSGLDRRIRSKIARRAEGEACGLGAERPQDRDACDLSVACDSDLRSDRHDVDLDATSRSAIVTVTELVPYSG